MYIPTSVTPEHTMNLCEYPQILSKLIPCRCRSADVSAGADEKKQSQLCIIDRSKPNNASNCHRSLMKGDANDIGNQYGLFPRSYGIILLVKQSCGVMVVLIEIYSRIVDSSHGDVVWVLCWYSRLQSYCCCWVSTEAWWIRIIMVLLGLYSGRLDY